MSEPLFDTDKCGIPFIPKVDFDFLPACQVQPAPGPINDCPAIEIPLDPPPIGQVCIDLGISSQLTTHVGPAALTMTATRVINNPGVECAYIIDVDLTIPEIPTFDDVCPTVSASATTVTGAGAPNLDVVVTRITDDGACSLKFDFNLDFPEISCPTFSVNATTTVSPGPPNVDVILTQEGDIDNCQVALDFNFQIPNPACPTITATATTTVASSPTPTVDIVVTKLPGRRKETAISTIYDAETSSSSTVLVEYDVSDSTRCSTHFDLNFSLPGCASIEAGGTLTVLPGVEPSVDVVATPKVDTCGTDFDFNFVLPCPELTATTTVTVSRGAPNAYVDVVRPIPSLCGVELQLSLTLPPAGIDCPTFGVSSHVTTAAGLTPSFSAVVTKRPTPEVDGVSQCEYDFDFFLTAPPVGLWPVTLLSNVSGGVATVQLPDMSFRLAYDNGQFPCARAGAQGIAAVDPTSGLTRLISSQSRAGDILCELTEPVNSQFSGGALVLRAWGTKGDVQFNTGTEPTVDLHDPGDIAKGAKAEENVIARWDCPNGVYVIVARGGEQRALLIQGILNEDVVGTESEIEIAGPTPLTPPPYTAIPEDDGSGAIMIKNPRKHMGQQDDNIVANWNDTQSQWELLDVERHWLRVMTDWYVNDEEKLVKKYRIIAAETWEAEDTATSEEGASCPDDTE